MVMGNPSWMTAFSYPANSTWPVGEVYFNTRYVYAHSEFTPQQTMRGKIALYGYLYGIRSGVSVVPFIDRHSNALSAHSPHSNIRKLSNGNYRITNSGMNQDRFASVKLFDCSGKLVQTITTQKIPAAGLVLETSLIGKGIYLLEIVRAGERELVKLANY
jgi:hypothetical protein